MTENNISDRIINIIINIEFLREAILWLSFISYP